MKRATHRAQQQARASFMLRAQEHTMDAIELLTTRASNGKLPEPAPAAESLRIAFEAAARAPDHASMRPWRMHIVRGAARERFGALLADVVKRTKPGATEDDLKQAAGKALRAP